MKAKRILEIIDEEQQRLDSAANEYSRRVLNVQAGGHDPVSLDNLNRYADMMEHRSAALGALKIRIYHEMRQEKKGAAIHVG